MKPAGTMIREAREAQRMSLRELARRVDVTPSTISILERTKGGCTNVSDATLATVADAVGLDADTVLAAAGRIAPDVHGILLHGGPDLWRALREAKRRGMTGGDLLRAAACGSKE